jgi:aerobic carbon-monoxide dehydrogenase medium subunit
LKPPRFRYVRPENLEELVTLRSDEDTESVILAGGQSLIPMMNFRLARPEVVLDVGGIGELRGIRRNGGDVVIGATTRQSEAMSAPEITASAPLVAEALRYVGHVAIRNRGTIGGSIAHADPSAELPVALLALDGSVVARGRSGQRTIPAAELFETAFMTSLLPTEVLVEVRVPDTAGARFSFREIARRRGDFALVNVAVAATVEGGRFTSVRIALGGVRDVPTRSEAAEQAALASEVTPAHIREVARVAADSVDPRDDFHASGRYRKQVTGVLVERALSDVSEALAEVA